jgi:hypothetical protein
MISTIREKQSELGKKTEGKKIYYRHPLFSMFLVLVTIVKIWLHNFDIMTIIHIFLVEKMSFF